MTMCSRVTGRVTVDIELTQDAWDDSETMARVWKEAEQAASHRFRTILAAATDAKFKLTLAHDVPVEYSVTLTRRK